MTTARRVVLVDGKNLVFRAHYSPGFNKLATSEGEPTSVLYGGLAMTLAVAGMVKEAPIVFVWDGGGETWRHRLFAEERGERVTHTIGEAVARRKVERGEAPKTWIDRQVMQSMARLSGERREKTSETVTTKPKVHGYKAHRDGMDSREEREIAVMQIPHLRKVLSLVGVRQFRVPGLEGDDLIGILSRLITQRGYFDEVIIYSTDKDFYQLMSPQVKILRGSPDGKLDWVTEEKIRAKYGVGVKDWVRYRSLTGDESDNIPNAMRGIGPKTALKLLAAGMDPTAEDYIGYSQGVKEALNKINKAPVNWAEFWPRMRRNALACKIVCNPKAEVLPLEIRERLGVLCGRTTREEFFRDRSGELEDRYRLVTEWLAEWEMVEMKDRRGELFNLV